MHNLLTDLHWLLYGIDHGKNLFNNQNLFHMLIVSLFLTVFMLQCRLSSATERN